MATYNVSIMFVSDSKTRRVRGALIGFATLGLTFVTVASAPSASAQTPAERAFIATGDAICKKSNVRLAEKALAYERHKLISRETTKSVNLRVAKPADVAEFVEKVAVREIANQLSELGALKPAPSQATAFAAALKEANRALDDIKAKPAEAAFRNPFVRSAKMFAALGFNSCGQAESRSKDA